MPSLTSRDDSFLLILGFPGLRKEPKKGSPSGHFPFSLCLEREARKREKGRCPEGPPFPGWVSLSGQREKGKCPEGFAKGEGEGFRKEERVGLLKKALRAEKKALRAETKIRKNQGKSWEIKGKSGENQGKLKGKIMEKIWDENQ